MSETQAKLSDALIPLLTLVVLLASSVAFFGEDSSYGPNQIALIASAFVAALVALKHGLTWQQIEKAMINGVSLSMGAIFILLAVGALIGTWILSGTVPTMIYYGLQLLSPSFFYAATCLICAIVALSIGSSWTVAATIGVALIGVAQGLGMDTAIAAGAIISGAYFGDKMSPFSDTTNLAPAVSGSELFAHIRHMTWTSVPSFLIALVLFFVIGSFSEEGASPEQIGLIQQTLLDNFSINPFHLAPLVILLGLAVKRFPAFPAVFLGAIVGAIWAYVFQADLLTAISGTESGLAQVKLIWTVLFAGVSLETGMGDLDNLLNGGGMSSMLNTVWLIVSAMIFGAVMEKAGFLAALIKAMLSKVRTTGGLVTSTVGTCIGTNVITGDQYISIVMPGRMYKEAYEQQGLDNRNLSRTLEDAGTLTSPLIPWNTCGAYMHSVLLVNPLEFFMYCFFNLLSPLFAIAYAYLGFKILKREVKTDEK